MVSNNDKGQGSYLIPSSSHSPNHIYDPFSRAGKPMFGQSTPLSPEAYVDINSEGSFYRGADGRWFREP